MDGKVHCGMRCNLRGPVGSGKRATERPTERATACMASSEGCAKGSNAGSGSRRQVEAQPPHQEQASALALGTLDERPERRRIPSSLGLVRDGKSSRVTLESSETQ